ncbi:MAG: exonuclease domain-containing protein [Chitinophagales bacterium]
MEFAIVDIETTGGYASANSITEVSIRIHDGKKELSNYQTLVKPDTEIPYYITGLTGITNQMVENAPEFEEVAAQIYGLLQGRIFVAHSVNFDYSFLKKQLADCGFELNTKKLCTIRLSRKILPGLPGYGLGKICGYLGITNTARHRAAGDTAATVQLFEHLLKNDTGNIIAAALKKGSKEQALPPNVPREEFDRLPQTPGVYYFHNSKGKIVYVGKAKSLKKRVSSHFSNNAPGRQKQNFMREVFHISFKECDNEFEALEFETKEIKRLWPAFNQAQKRYEPAFAIIDYYDQLGFRRLAIEKLKRKGQAPLHFPTYIDGFNALKQLSVTYSLCPRLSGIATDRTLCEASNCSCLQETANEAYNNRVTEAISSLQLIAGETSAEAMLNNSLPGIFQL